MLEGLLLSCRHYFEMFEANLNLFDLVMSSLQIYKCLVIVFNWTTIRMYNAETWTLK